MAKRKKIFCRLLMAGMLFAIPVLSCSPLIEKGEPEREPQGESNPGAQTIRPSGLRAEFPAEARCSGIASAFGSHTRHDGSLRPPWAPGGGSHGGIDISLPVGTPLLALAAGTVAAIGNGGQLTGFYLWLRHSPKHTGLPYWLYSKYQHLQDRPKWTAAESVALGQVIVHSGNTGTTGGHFGAAGYPHLHLTTRMSPDGGLDGSRLIDPLEMFRDATTSEGPSTHFPSRDVAVQIPYATVDGRIRPEGTRVVWPVACTR